MSADMTGKKRSRGPAFVAILLMGLATLPALADGNTAPDGSTLATEYWSACHRVTAEQPQPPAVVMAGKYRPRGHPSSQLPRDCPVARAPVLLKFAGGRDRASLGPVPPHQSG